MCDTSGGPFCRAHWIRPRRGAALHGPPLQGLGSVWRRCPGRCPGLVCYAPSGLLPGPPRAAQERQKRWLHALKGLPISDQGNALGLQGAPDRQGRPPSQDSRYRFTAQVAEARPPGMGLAFGGSAPVDQGRLCLSISWRISRTAGGGSGREGVREPAGAAARSPGFGVMTSAENSSPTSLDVRVGAP